MQDNQPELAWSRTFKIVGSVRSGDDQSAQWAQVVSGRGGVRPVPLSGGLIIDSKYRIIDLVGTGGMGSVYRVQHLLLDKEMALKTLSETTLTPGDWQRFQREAQAIAKLTHVNIVQVFDFGIGPDNMPFYTMELLSGQSLAERLNSHGRLSLDQALPIFAAAAEALTHAHNLGIVHCDVKPANIFLKEEASGKQVVKVVDFGIAKLATWHNLDDQSQTEAGEVFGSPLYMSPEQLLGVPTDRRTDIYSFGCSMFEALTGRPPFCGNTALETFHMHLQDMPPSLVEASGGLLFSQRAQALVAKLLAKDADKRYQTFEEVLVELRNLPGKGGASSAGMSSAMPIPDKNTALALNTDEDTQQKSQGNTGPLSGLPKQSAMLGSGAVALLALTLGSFYFASVANKQSQAKLRPSPMAKAMVETTYRSQTGPIPSAASTIPVQTEPMRPYSYPTAGGGRVFEFPKDMAIGVIKCLGHQPQPARGEVTMPPLAIDFKPGTPMCDKPELFRHFRKDDLDSLNCNDVDQDLGSVSSTDPKVPLWGKRHLEAITSSLTGLSALDFTGSDIDGTSTIYLNRLKQLTNLRVSNTGLTGGDLAKIERLSHLVFLDANEVKDMREALQKLKGSKDLERLSVCGCHLGDADVQTISTMQALKYLIMNYNQIGKVGLGYLSRLPHLELLAIGGEKLGPECIEAFRGFKHLHCLELTDKDWSEDDRSRLKSVLPAGCEIRPFSPGILPDITN